MTKARSVVLRTPECDGFVRAPCTLCKWQLWALFT